MSTSSRTTFSFDSKASIETSRSYRSKEIHFFNKHGQLLHSYDPEKAPYPQSYDKEVLGLYVANVAQTLNLLFTLIRDLLDHGFMLKIQHSVSFVDWKGNPPTSVLDLGCGVRAHQSISFYICFSEPTI
jgi:hypothetical protein